MTVPFLDLNAHHTPIKDEVLKAIGEVIDQSAFAGGPFVERFETEFSHYCGCRQTVGLGNGTESLWLALRAHRIGPGDEIITVPNTFVATVEAICQTGAKPVFVDIEEESYNMDPGAISKAISPRTKAIIPVHMFGQTADMDPILKIADSKGIFVLEDAAQAVGAEYKGRRAGSIGHCTSFSFYPGKNLGAFGEAGAITTDDSGITKKIRSLRDHGQLQKHRHDLVGWNGRMDGIQAAILSIKLKRLDQATENRRTNASLYQELLTGFGPVTLPVEKEDHRHAYHIFSIRVKNRDSVLQGMRKEGVRCAIHYPIPIHLQKAYRFLGYPEGSFPIAEKCASEFLSLPIYPELSTSQIEQVASRLIKVVTRECALVD